MQEQERQWLARAQAGDAQAFGQLVEVYQRPVFNLCYRMLGDSGEAEDAAQEAFLKAYRALKRYDPTQRFVNWLLTIASNHCIDLLRRRRLRIISLEALPPWRPPRSPEPSLETHLLREEQADLLHQLLGRLSPVDRSAVVMRYWNDLSYEEIAQVLSLSTSAVKSRLHRARKALAVAWMEHEKAVPAGVEGA